MNTGTPVPATAPLNNEQRDLVEENLGLVRSIASSWRARCRSSLEHADLVQVGALALSETARRYDPSREVPFAALASQRIRGAIRDHLRGIDPLSRGQRSSVRELQAATSSLANRLGRPSEVEEVGEELGWDVDRVQHVRGLATSLEHGWAQTQALPEDDFARAPGCATLADDPQAETLKSEQVDELRRALEGLSERERLVLDLHFRQELKLAEIGDILGVTESRVSQLRSAAILRLRRRLRSRLGPHASLAGVL